MCVITVSVIKLLTIQCLCENAEECCCYYPEHSLKADVERGESCVRMCVSVCVSVSVNSCVNADGATFIIIPFKRQRIAGQRLLMDIPQKAAG